MSENEQIELSEETKLEIERLVLASMGRMMTVVVDSFQAVSLASSHQMLKFMEESEGVEWMTAAQVPDTPNPGQWP